MSLSAVMMRNLILYCILYLYTLCLTVGCNGNGDLKYQQLEQLEAKNHAGEQLLNDSLAESIVKYFKRYGGANEQMRSHYILGRTYYCMGELPRSLEIYNEAINSADTLSDNCDYARLSRVYAQKAKIFYDQIQPQGQLDSYRLAEHYAWKGNDTLMAIECLTSQAYAYKLLKMEDSALIITDSAAVMFEKIGRLDRAAQEKASEITTLIKRNELTKAKEYINIYESLSGLIDSLGNIHKGHEIYYYIKGCYYLATDQIDSSEYLFRKELRDGKDLNNQIAGCKGLQKIYEHKKIPDSIAKYATLSYELNDSAYSLSEMQNIQKLQASYNYNHKKHLAEKKTLEAERAWLIVTLIILMVMIFGGIFGWKYHETSKLALDYRLRNADITRHMKEQANSIPPIYPNLKDWYRLRQMIEKKIPSFRKAVKADVIPLSDLEYDVCLMIRVQLSPKEISTLKKCSPSYISNIRKRLLLSIFGKEGRSEEFDDEIGRIY